MQSRPKGLIKPNIKPIPAELKNRIGENMIKKLEYINDFYFEPNQSLLEKMDKVTEEFKEVDKSHFEMLTGKGTASELAQELLDLIHSSINMLKKMDKEELITYDTEMFKHSIKLIQYLESGKYEL